MKIIDEVSARMESATTNKHLIYVVYCVILRLLALPCGGHELRRGQPFSFSLVSFVYFTKWGHASRHNPRNMYTNIFPLTISGWMIRRSRSIRWGVTNWKLNENSLCALSLYLSPTPTFSLLIITRTRFCTLDRKRIPITILAGAQWRYSCTDYY